MNTSIGASEIPDHDTASADVVVVGMGPVGQLISILLGRKGYTVIAVDRWPEPYPLPRAVTFDHEAARILSAVGIDADDDPSIDYYDSLYQLLDADREILQVIDWVSRASDGWRNRYWFDQPALEERLRTIAASIPTIANIRGFEAVGLDEDASGATVRLAQTRVDGGLEKTVRGKFLIGADGANSFIRKAAGLTMTDLDFNYDWIVIDIVEHEEHSYDPPHYQVCDPRRPFTVVPGGPGRRRWEFMLLPGETPEDFDDAEAVWSLLEKFDIRPDNSEMVRHVVWRFQARYAEQWRKGRTILAGDAAHLMPPFAGEGMCAGLRDAYSLAWRLDLVLSGRADTALLDTYGEERKPHAKWYIDFSIGLGEAICVTDHEVAMTRNRTMKAEWAEQSKLGPVEPYQARLGEGVFDVTNPIAGLPSVQGVVSRHGNVGKFDSVVGRDWALISLAEAAGEVTPTVREVLHGLGGSTITIGGAEENADLIDVEGTYRTWLSELDVRHVLIRPDFYTAGTATDTTTLEYLATTIAGRASIDAPSSLQPTV